MKKNNEMSVYWSQLGHEDWKIYVAATPAGLCYVGSANKPFDELSDWVQARLPGSELIRDDAYMQPYAAELSEYLRGERRQFARPVDFRGTAFQQAVWDALCAIPYGETRSYSDIAEQIHKPAAVRAVGTAIGANPVLITVPCHRVVGKNGSLTGYRGGLEMKKRLLELERAGGV